MTKTVLILGGSYAGLHIAHHLLKHPPTSDLKVILVSKNSHFYWNLASVRAVVPESPLQATQLFAPLTTILSRYPSDSYELVIGTATSSDLALRTVTLDNHRTIPYDHLVIATGARTASASHSTPWKADGSYEEVLDLLHSLADRVSAASHIVVAGAGATGCELAAELAFDNPHRQTRKEIVLLSADAEVLGADSIAASVRSELAKLRVQVRTGARVDSVREVDGGKTEVVLAGGGGETIVTDLYLPTMGLVPNTEFVEARFKDERGRVLVDEFLGVKGAEGVWAAGDAVGRPRCGFLITQKQAAGVAKNVEAALKDKPPTVVKGMPFDIFTCATGRSRAAGRMGAVKMLSIMAWMGKGRTLGLNYMAGYVDGSVA
ncbi:putative disulfide oxidoreductase [Coniochaeta sp. PMI_546]|nr:putative disulfide oxidoreductase [Coniochaeta sp. PMI_546]